MTETHSLGEWEKEFDELLEDNLSGNAFLYKKNDYLISGKNLIRSVLLAQKEGFRREIEGKMFKGEFLHDDDVYTPRDINNILYDLLTKLDTEKVEIEEFYECVERKPYWVRKTNGLEISREKYAHQDGSFSNMCAASFCRCQD